LRSKIVHRRKKNERIEECWLGSRIVHRRKKNERIEEYWLRSKTSLTDESPEKGRETSGKN
jgi:hypothetical protein